MSIGFATTVQIGDHYRVKVNRGAGKCGYAGKFSHDRKSLREDWFKRPDAQALPFIYGYRVSVSYDDGKVQQASSWAQYKGRLYGLFFRYYWSKDGSEGTVQISVRRQVANGYVWTNKRYVGPLTTTSETGFMHAVSDAIVSNSMIAEANAPASRKTNTGNYTPPMPERALPTADWSA